MTRSLSPKVTAYAGLTGAGLLAALALRLPELVGLAAPFALVATLALSLARPPDLDVDVELERERVLEGDEVEAVVELRSAGGVPHLELLLELQRGLELSDGDDPVVLRVGAGEQRDLRFLVACTRWGAYRLGRVIMRARDPLGFVVWEWHVDRRRPLKVYPGEEFVRGLLAPLETQVFSGNHVARQRGEGIEFADLRPFVPGDRMRRVNWRASARRGELWVNEHHPERNTDIVLFLDTFAEESREGRSTLDLALRASVSVTAGYLRQKDRVGFVTFGGMLNWLRPATGTTQLYRIVDSLLDTQIVLNYAWKDIDVLPRRTLPPHAMVIALTPLLDDRAASALLDLSARGFDLSILEISPLGFLEPPANEAAEVGLALWSLRREALRDRFRKAGVPLALWDEQRPLAVALEEVTTFRRFARVASA
ncbi:MAG TPA: DUF58 domain-containing protein [Gaiellaceae bacterium]|nr:DUF58 domain-containing protein [Gaiellaceae bacterium]